MKICLMTQNPQLYSSKRIIEAAKARDHEIDVLDTPNAYMNVVSHKPRVKYKGHEVPIYDAVIPRIGASTTFYGLAVLRQFEMMGVRPLSSNF